MNANSWDADAYDDRFGFVARYGDDLVDDLDPSPGQLILDLGCGTGRHAAAMTARGAQVVGMDADPAMLARARIEHPEVTFVEADATLFDLGTLGAQRPFDGCLSNAALHWMTDQASVLRNVRTALRSGAPFVAEMGGAGNIAALDESLRVGSGRPRPRRDPDPGQPLPDSGPAVDAPGSRRVPRGARHVVPAAHPAASGDDGGRMDPAVPHRGVGRDPLDLASGPRACR